MDSCLFESYTVYLKNLLNKCSLPNLSYKYILYQLIDFIINFLNARKQLYNDLNLNKKLRTRQTTSIHSCSKFWSTLRFLDETFRTCF